MAARCSLLPLSLVVSVGAFAACSGETQTTTVTSTTPGGTAELKAFAFSETKKQARRTCASVPREVLTAAFAERSSDLPFGEDLRRYDDNAIALLYVEDIDINPIRLQSAAYKGCLAGLEDQASPSVVVPALKGKSLSAARTAGARSGVSVAEGASLGTTATPADWLFSHRSHSLGPGFPPDRSSASGLALLHRAEDVHRRSPPPMFHTAIR